MARYVATKKLAGELPMSERFLQQPVRLAYCLFRAGVGIAAAAIYKDKIS
jgi:hypothetical protein